MSAGSTNGKGVYRARSLRGLFDEETYEYSDDCMVSTPRAVAAESMPPTISYSLFPNPADDYLTIQVAGIDGAASIPVEIRNGAGIVVLTSTVDSQSYMVNISTLPAGIYYLTSPARVIEASSFIEVD